VKVTEERKTHLNGESSLDIAKQDVKIYGLPHTRNNRINKRYLAMLRRHRHFLGVGIENQDIGARRCFHLPIYLSIPPGTPPLLDRRRHVLQAREEERTFYIVQ